MGGRGTCLILDGLRELRTDSGLGIGDWGLGMSDWGCVISNCKLQIEESLRVSQAGSFSGFRERRGSVVLRVRRGWIWISRSSGSTEKSPTICISILAFWGARTLTSLLK